jgi:hypothetical protein
MEKTLQFALNEALEIGRQSAMPEFLEMELREKIAQDLEAFCSVGRCVNYEGTWVCSHYVDAMIVRGKVKVKR